jgi:hypothetical protein
MVVVVLSLPVAALGAQAGAVGRESVSSAQVSSAQEKWGREAEIGLGIEDIRLEIVKLDRSVEEYIEKALSNSAD